MKIVPILITYCFAAFRRSKLTARYSGSDVVEFVSRQLPRASALEIYIKGPPACKISSAIKATSSTPIKFHILKVFALMKLEEDNRKSRGALPGL